MATSLTTAELFQNWSYLIILLPAFSLVLFVISLKDGPGFVSWQSITNLADLLAYCLYTLSVIFYIGFYFTRTPIASAVFVKTWFFLFFLALMIFIYRLTNKG